MHVFPGLSLPLAISPSRGKAGTPTPLPIPYRPRPSWPFHPLSSDPTPLFPFGTSVPHTHPHPGPTLPLILLYPFRICTASFQGHPSIVFEYPSVHFEPEPVPTSLLDNHLSFLSRDAYVRRDVTREGSHLGRYFLIWFSVTVHEEGREAGKESERTHLNHLFRMDGTGQRRAPPSLPVNTQKGGGGGREGGRGLELLGIPVQSTTHKMI